MCIRDSQNDPESHPGLVKLIAIAGPVVHRGRQLQSPGLIRHAHRNACLLYTSDAADERSSVDLGGRRIIKKQKTRKIKKKKTLKH